MGKRKPWLKYHKLNAPVREYHAPPKTPRELFWARFWLIVGVQIGAHKAYLWQYKSAFLWFLFYSSIVIGLLPVGDLVFPENAESFVAISLIPIWIIIICIEYRRLPKLVRTANEEQFGEKEFDDPILRGEIGPYAEMRPIILALVVSYFGLIIIAIGWPNSNLALVPLLLVFITISFATIQYSKIRKQKL